MSREQKSVAETQQELINETYSLCPVCLERIPAANVAYGENIYLEKSCPEHGFYRTLVWYGKPDYRAWLRQENNTPPAHHERSQYNGCPYDCGICPEHRQEACCVLVEITHRCDQACSYCFANAGESMPEMNLAELNDLFNFLIRCSSDHPYLLQLSGGEPTMRRDLPDIISLAKSKGFSYIQLNTNGKRLGSDSNYAQTLAAAGLDIIFMQFDGMDDQLYQSIRGEKLFDVKKQAIANCRAAGLGVVLVPTVIPQVNSDHIGRIIDFMLENLPAVRGIHFQPVSYFGRFPQAPRDEMRMTIPELLTSIEEQTQGRLKIGDFLPLLSGNCRCSFHGNFMLMPDGTISAVTDPKQSGCCSCKQDAIVQARNYIGKKWSQCTTLNGINDVGNYRSEWDILLKRLNLESFSITAMAFQDCWNIDLDRLQKCRVHVATPSHKLIPFCAYNLTDNMGRNLYGRYT